MKTRWMIDGYVVGRPANMLYHLYASDTLRRHLPSIFLGRFCTRNWVRGRLKWYRWWWCGKIYKRNSIIQRCCTFTRPCGCPCSGTVQKTARYANSPPFGRSLRQRLTVKSNYEEHCRITEPSSNLQWPPKSWILSWKKPLILLSMKWSASQ